MAAGGVEERQEHVKKHRVFLKVEEKSLKIDDKRQREGAKKWQWDFLCRRRGVKWLRETDEGRQVGKVLNGVREWFSLKLHHGLSELEYFLILNDLFLLINL